MHLQYNNTSYALCAYDPLTIIIIFTIISLFNDMQSYPPYYNPSGLSLNSLSFNKFSFYAFILYPIFWI